MHAQADTPSARELASAARRTGPAASARRPGRGRRRPRTSSCETRSTPAPCSASGATSASRNRRWDSASTPAIGSSSTSSVGLARERPGDERPLLLAARELVDRPRRGPPGPPTRSRGSTAAVVRALTRSPPAAARQTPGGHDLLDGGRDLRGQRRALRHVARDATRSHAPGALAEQPHRSPRRDRATRAAS